MTPEQVTEVTTGISTATDTAVSVGVAILIVGASIYAIRVVRRMIGG